MKYFCAALILAMAVCGGDAASGKETCTHTWGKGDYKTFKQVQDEIQGRLGNGKILRFSLCGNANDHYFQVTVLDPSGKVRILRLAAR
jgi:DnaJ-class molecular chaperone